MTARRLLALVLGAALLAGAATRASGANFTAATASSASLGAGTLAAPTALTAVPEGSTISLAFTAATGARSATVESAPAAGSSCASLTWSALGSTTTTAITDPATGVTPGAWRCYRATSVAGTFTSLAPSTAVAVRAGVLVVAAALTNAGDRTGCGAVGGVAGTLDCGDTVRLTFNQPLDTATGPSATPVVCATLTGTVVLALDTLCAVPLLTLTGSGASVSTSAAAAAVWSGGGRVLTYRLTATPALAVPIPPTQTLGVHPSVNAALLRSATGAVHVCDADPAGGSCLPQTTGSI